MLIATLKYTRPLEEVDACLPKHVAYLKPFFETGKLLVAGRMTNGIAGIIIAHQITREEFETILKNDPYQEAKVAAYEIVEFNPRLVNPHFLPLLG